MNPSTDSANANEFRSGVVRVAVVFVNTYLVDINPGVPADGWVLIDTGLRGLGGIEIRRAAAERYGAKSRPRAVVLTHGHFDHAGSALALASEWNAPVFAHPLELPYLTGQSHYPPPDPTVGGALAMLSRAFPQGGSDLSGHVQALAADGAIPLLPGWRAVHTPGHSAGHVSLWRESDGTLIAGDALATMNQESWMSTLTMPRELRQPPAPMTTDWGAARESLRRLADLGPTAIAAGHGLPMAGPGMTDALRAFADTFAPPATGRYVRQPARFDERGIVEIPPPVADPVGNMLRVAAGSALIAAVMFTLTRRHRRI